MNLSNLRIGLTSLTLATLIAACGSTSAGSLMTNGDAGPIASPSEAGAQVAESDAATPSNDASATKKDAGKVDAATNVDRRIDPIEVGRAWTYNVKVLGFYPECENGIGVATTLKKSVVDGKTAFEVQSLCKDAGTFLYAVEGDRVFYRYGGEWKLGTDEPVQAGHTWNDDTYDYVWVDEGTVTVAAGTFDDCWTAKRDTSFDSYTTFCRGVGPVHWHYEDGLGNGYDAILASKNF